MHKFSISSIIPFVFECFGPQGCCTLRCGIPTASLVWHVLHIEGMGCCTATDAPVVPLVRLFWGLNYERCCTIDKATARLSPSKPLSFKLPVGDPLQNIDRLCHWWYSVVLETHAHDHFDKFVKLSGSGDWPARTWYWQAFAAMLPSTTCCIPFNWRVEGMEMLHLPWAVTNSRPPLPCAQAQHNRACNLPKALILPMSPSHAWPRILGSLTVTLSPSAEDLGLLASCPMLPGTSTRQRPWWDSQCRLTVLIHMHILEGATMAKWQQIPTNQLLPSTSKDGLWSDACSSCKS